MVVAAARTLIEASTSQGKASKADAWVAARAEALGIAGPHGKTISPDMVRNWRSTYRQNPALIEAVDEHVAKPSATDLQEARGHAESLLRRSFASPAGMYLGNPPLTQMPPCGNVVRLAPTSAQLRRSHSMSEQYFSTVEVALVTGISKSTLEKWRVAGGGIPYIKAGRLA